MRVAVVGGGISGLAAADVLTKAGVQVVLYEKEDYLGGHARSVHIEDIDLDLGFMVFNRVGFPNTVEFFDNLGVEMEPSDMSFSVSLDGGNGYEWGSRNHLSSVFAQKKNLFNPHFWAMLFDVVKFRNDAIKYIEELENNPQIDRYETLGQFIKSRGYSELFHKAFLIPLCASIWSCPSEAVMAFSAFSVLSLLHNQHLLQLFGAPQWMTLRRRSCSYVKQVLSLLPFVMPVFILGKKIHGNMLSYLHWFTREKQVQEQLENRGCQIRTCCEVEFVLTVDEGCAVLCQDGSMEIYTRCIIAADAPNALKMLGKDAKYDEIRILGAFQYFYSDVFLHHDKNLMPGNLSAWGAWNFLGCMENKVCATYWLNVLQNLGDTSLPFLMTLNPPHMPEHTLLKWSFGLSAPTVSTVKASSELHHIQGKRGIWYCGAYVGCGFHEDGLKARLAGMVAAHGILRKNCALLNNPKPMVISPLERGARHLVSLFLRSHISTGCLMLLEEGGTVFTFQGTGTRSLLKAALKVHNPQFYSKVVTQAELGLAYAYIDGDFSVIDKDEGLINLLMILIANRDLNSFVSRSNYKRNRWRPLFSTVGVASAKYIFRHVPRQNNLIQSRRNISLHYDLNNDLFATFLDETMTYSCAVFERKDEDLKVAQLRKIANLIKKAKIEKQHEVLEIGCGWGSLAIEVAQQTGCNYTGITFSEQQHRLAEKRVKEAGLQ
ncbi:hypothetical protein RJ641_003816, partial [Dillenia turbinata]